VKSKTQFGIFTCVLDDIVIKNNHKNGIIRLKQYLAQKF